MNDLEKEMGAAVDDAVSETPAREWKPENPPTLTDQWGTLESVEQELRKRIRRERMDIAAKHERLIVEVNQDYDRRIEYAVSELEEKRRKSLRALTEETNERVREHELLAKRMG